MLKAFILIFDSYVMERKEILDYIDSRDEVKNWYAFFPTGIFIISSESASTLAYLLRGLFKENKFFITEVDVGKNDGWLDKDNWEFINNPKSSGRWP